MANSKKTAEKKGKKAARKSKRARRSAVKLRRHIPDSVSFLAKASAEVRAGLTSASALTEFLASAGDLSPQDRTKIVDQALVMLEGLYVHLPLKRAMHGIDPLQRLRLLRHRLGDLESDTEFHQEMLEIFVSLRDLHTNYVLPAPYQGRIAFLPFLVEEYHEGGERRYLVTSLLRPTADPEFVPGVELTYWNGAPIARAVLRSADQHAGSNTEARRARGVEGLTLRSLSASLPPDEEWVVVTYRTAAGDEQEIRLDWAIFEPTPAGGGDAGDAGLEARKLAGDIGLGEVRESALMGIDLEGDELRRARKVLFAPHVVKAEKRCVRNKSGRTRVGAADLSTGLPSVLTAKIVDTPDGTFGYIRIRAFSEDVPNFLGTFLNEFALLLEQMPPSGLILDVRDNPGGIILAGEFLLQFLTPKTIEPESLQFINTPLTLEVAEANAQELDLEPWVESIGDAVEIGSVYSRGFPLTSPDLANLFGQFYFGPAVLVTNAKCYSTTDFFAAGFKDHEIGRILGTDDNTGAGGANVWGLGLLQDVLPNVFGPLPGNASMRVSIRRSIRVRANAGTPLEDLGVKPTDRHFMTKNDLLNGNEDLINAAASILAGMPRQNLLVAEVPAAGGAIRFDLTTENIERLDIYLDGRPLESVDVAADGTSQVTVQPAAGGSDVEIQGFRGGELVAKRKLLGVGG